MHIQVLYFKGCPNYLDAVDNLNHAIRSLSMQRVVTLKLEEIRTQEQAEQSHFVGSPTFLLDGQDMFGEPPDATYGLRCRIYLLGGKATGLPSVADFTALLRDKTDRPRPQSVPGVPH